MRRGLTVNTRKLLDALNTFLTASAYTALNALSKKDGLTDNFRLFGSAKAYWVPHSHRPYKTFLPGRWPFSFRIKITCPLWCDSCAIRYPRKASG